MERHGYGALMPEGKLDPNDLVCGVAFRGGDDGVLHTCTLEPSHAGGHMDVPSAVGWTAEASRMMSPTAACGDG